MVEKDNAANKTHNGDGGDNGRRADYRPGRRWNRRGAKERRWPFHQILGEFRDGISTGDGAAVDREALQEGELTLAVLAH